MTKLPGDLGLFPVIIVIDFPTQVPHPFLLDETSEHKKVCKNVKLKKTDFWMGGQVLPFSRSRWQQRSTTSGVSY